MKSDRDKPCQDPSLFPGEAAVYKKQQGTGTASLLWLALANSGVSIALTFATGQVSSSSTLRHSGSAVKPVFDNSFLTRRKTCIDKIVDKHQVSQSWTTLPPTSVNR